MLVPIVMIFVFGYSEFICMLFFSRTLEQRYSRKTTIWGTSFVWAIGCLIKLPVFFNVGMAYLAIQNALVMVLQCCYQYFLFKATFFRRVLAMLLLYVYVFFVEMVSFRLAGLICVGEQFVQIDSAYTIATQMIVIPLVSLCFFPFLALWRLVLRIDSKNEGKMWLSVFLPFSQYLFMENLIEAYIIKQRNIPILFIFGILLGVLADVYMFVLFYKENQREKLEKELYLEQQLYQKEHVYYECLKENQKEVSRMRHDFQNYVLVFRNMLQNMP